MGGTPLQRQRAEGSGSEAILRDYPELKSEDITACLDYARELAMVETAA